MSVAEEMKKRKKFDRDGIHQKIVVACSSPASSTSSRLSAKPWNELNRTGFTLQLRPGGGGVRTALEKGNGGLESSPVGKPRGDKISYRAEMERRSRSNGDLEVLLDTVEKRDPAGRRVPSSWIELIDDECAKEVKEENGETN